MSLARQSVRVWTYVLRAAVAALMLCTVGCAPKLPSSESLVAFEEARPLQLSVDIDRLVKAKISTGPYRVVPGDVLEVRIPAAVRNVSAQSQDLVNAYLCRVDDANVIRLPLIGRMAVSGKTLSQIETAVVDGYCPKYVKKKPQVVVRVAEYRTTAVSIVGAVEQPGLYRLRSDEKSLVALLMKAGGITKDGAAVIRIHHSSQLNETKELALPVKGMSIPFADIALKGGESVEVERLDPAVFTVIGLVNRAGTYPYPPGAKYNLLQAVGFAGGLKDVAGPQYVIIHRRGADDQVVSAVFKIDGSNATDPARIFIRAGDVIAAEHTARTRTRQVLADIFRFSTGIYAGASYNLSPSSN